MLVSLSRVKIPRKVVFKGILFQNNVEDVFNIHNLVRPKFLKHFEIREIMFVNNVWCIMNNFVQFLN